MIFLNTCIICISQQLKPMKFDFSKAATSLTFFGSHKSRNYEHRDNFQVNRSFNGYIYMHIYSYFVGFVFCRLFDLVFVFLILYSPNRSSMLGRFVSRSTSAIKASISIPSRAFAVKAANTPDELKDIMNSTVRPFIFFSEFSSITGFILVHTVYIHRDALSQCILILYGPICFSPYRRTLLSLTGTRRGAVPARCSLLSIPSSLINSPIPLSSRLTSMRSTLRLLRVSLLSLPFLPSSSSRMARLFVHSPAPTRRNLWILSSSTSKLFVNS